MAILNDGIMYSDLKAKIDYTKTVDEFNSTLDNLHMQILNYKDVSFNAENSVSLVIN